MVNIGEETILIKNQVWLVTKLHGLKLPSSTQPAQSLKYYYKPKNDEK